MNINFNFITKIKILSNIILGFNIKLPEEIYIFQILHHFLSHIFLNQNHHYYLHYQNLILYFEEFLLSLLTAFHFSYRI